MPRYRDVLQKTWRANRDFYRHMAILSLVAGPVLSGFFTWVQGRSGTPGVSSWWTFILVAAIVTGLIGATVARIWYLELAANSLKATADITGGSYLGAEKARWESIAVHWKLLHTDDNTREVFIGISQELEGAPTREHLRTAKYLAAL